MIKFALLVFFCLSQFIYSYESPIYQPNDLSSSKSDFGDVYNTSPISSQREAHIVSTSSVQNNRRSENQAPPTLLDSCTYDAPVTVTVTHWKTTGLSDTPLPTKSARSHGQESSKTKLIKSGISKSSDLGISSRQVAWTHTVSSDKRNRPTIISVSKNQISLSGQDLRPSEGTLSSHSTSNTKIYDSDAYKSKLASVYIRPSIIHDSKGASASRDAGFETDTFKTSAHSSRQRKSTVDYTSLKTGDHIESFWTFQVI